MCSATFSRRDLLMKHLETHDKTKQQVQMVSSVHPVVGNTTQKLLQETIDEALRDSASGEITAKNIQFHSCDSCSVTFLNEALYLQHMKQHKTAQGSATQKTSNAGYATGRTNNGSYSADESIKQESGQGAGISDDLESIFERMHSDKSTDPSTTNTENLVITQENTSSGGITFNITIPQSAASGGQENATGDQHQIGIDMPSLDGDDSKQIKQDEGHDGETMHGQPVSMPSLDDEQDATQESQQSNTDAVPMELDEIQNSADGQQIKFILNDNGQILSLDNHILTTDMDGNQILVQGTDMEQLQALLQSGGVVMQGEDGLSEGQTLQMMTTSDGQQQVVILQGPDGQEQLIDASMLDADGNIVIQQHPTGELNAEGTHITTEDGIQIPVSMAFSTGGDGDHITVTEGSEQHMQLLQQQAEAEQQQSQEGGQTLMLLQQGGEEQESENIKDEQDDQSSQEETSEAQETTTTNTQPTTSSNSDQANTSGDGGFLNFDELIQPQIIQKVCM